MKRFSLGLMGCLLLAGCQGDGESGVVDTVLQDFGLQDRPEGYVSNADRVFERLDEVGRTEIQRLNAENRYGEVKYDDSDPLRGLYYKEVKVYEDFHPLEAQPAARVAGGDRGGYVGYIEFGYRIHQSIRNSSKTEAAASAATLPTSERGSETRRFRFSQGGHWLGGEGEMIR